MNELAVFRSFPSPADAVPVITLLEEAGIYCNLVSGLQVLPDSLMGQFTGHKVDLQVLVSDFARANELLEKNALLLYQDVPDDYYLYNFTSTELLDVVRNKDEWNEFDRALAEALLKQEGIQLTMAEKERINMAHLNNLRTPYAASAYTLFFGYSYICSAVVLPTGIWLAGLAVGGYLGWSSRRLPDGQKVWLYDSRSRQHGKAMIVIGLGLFLLLLTMGLPVYRLFDRIDWSLFHAAKPDVLLPE